MGFGAPHPDLVSTPGPLNVYELHVYECLLAMQSPAAVLRWVLQPLRMTVID